MATVKLDPAKGIQIPNLTTSERNAISSPETGAIIWNTTTSEINQYNGSAWEITYTDTNTQIAGITSSADATAITIDSSENVGIGKTPESYYSNFKAVEIGGGSTGVLSLQGRTSDAASFINRNSYFDSTNIRDEYIATGYAQGIVFNTNGSISLRTAASGSADAAVTWNNVITADSDGLKFNDDTAAANALDDYEEGTWTPTLATGTLSGAYGKYIKIGKMCYISFHMSNFSDKTTNADVIIRSIPFTQAGTFAIGTVIGYQNGNSNPMGLITGATFTEFKLFALYNASSWQVQKHNTLGGDPNYYITGVYQTT